MKIHKFYSKNKVNLNALKKHLEENHSAGDYIETEVEGELFGQYKSGFFMAIPAKDKPDEEFFLSYDGEENTEEIFGELERELLQKALK